MSTAERPLHQKIYTFNKQLIACWISTCIFFAGCTTTKISSHTFEKVERPYSELIVAFTSGGNFLKKKAVEDEFFIAMQAEGIKAIPSYRIILPGASREATTDAILSSGVDAILLIENGGESKSQYALNGTQLANGMDSRGNAYTYQTPATENYSSTSRDFRVSLIDIRKNKIVWIAGSSTNTLTPAELAMFSDFHNSAIRDFISTLLNEMKTSGIIRKKIKAPDQPSSSAR